MPDKNSANISADYSMRLDLVHSLFLLANFEISSRSEKVSKSTDSGNTQRYGDENSYEHTAAELQNYISRLNGNDLIDLRNQLARNFLIEVDRLISGVSVTSKGNDAGTKSELDLTRSLGESTNAADLSSAPRVGLVSLPWISSSMPSIQLATLAAVLEAKGISSTVHELYVDYAAQIGLNLYEYLGNFPSYLQEWIFSHHYYNAESGKEFSAMVRSDTFSFAPQPALSNSILEALEPITANYLYDIIEENAWSSYDIIGCSLTISQLGSSMAFARSIKDRYPHIKIIFGGSQCAGVMGRTILKICPYVDVVVHIEGEIVLPELIENLRTNQALDELPGISYRSDTGDIVSTPSSELYETTERPRLNYDAYFQRISCLNLTDKIKPWLPFESSRGCWYGQKVQCTFCGLHEIMKFRSWPSASVLSELEHFYLRYDATQFYSVDLILPQEFLRSLFPKIISRGHNWNFFYEIKANMQRRDLEILAEAGVRWVQPGIESLDSELLKLMKKGVSPLQNILLLKWSEELGISCGWNLLHGLPGENRESYDKMIQILPKIYHLRPPIGSGQFQLHRFSPYFNNPKEFGICNIRAHPLFKQAFPISKKDLDNLVYLHEFDVVSGSSISHDYGIRLAISQWRRAYKRGASLELVLHKNGTSQITDTRQKDPLSVTYDLSLEETALYLFLDKVFTRKSLKTQFAVEYYEHSLNLSRNGGILAVIDRWISDGLILELDGKIITLATHKLANKENPLFGKSIREKPPIAETIVN